MQATALTSYQVDPNDPDCRNISFEVLVDDQPGSAQVRLCDLSESGGLDRFEIQLSTGSSAAGDLVWCLAIGWVEAASGRPGCGIGRAPRRWMAARRVEEAVSQIDKCP